MVPFPFLVVYGKMTQWAPSALVMELPAAEPSASSISAQDLALEIQADWKRASDAATSAVQRAMYLASPECHREVDVINQETEHLRLRLAEAKQRIAEMESIVNRFAAVQDPVVASDGFTYDRAQLQAYLEECAALNMQPVSHQNQQSLTGRYIPNNSLKRLVDVLRPLFDASGSSAAAAPTGVAPIG